MDYRKTWKKFGAVFGLTILHPQFLLNRSARQRRRRMKEFLSGTILDIGSGDSPSLSQCPGVKRYVSLDYPATNARYGQRPGIFGDARNLPFKENSFDRILLMEVLEHIPDPSVVPQEIHRCLKEGGLLFLSTPCFYPLHDEPHDYQRYTRHGLKWLFPEPVWERLAEEEFSGFFGFLALSCNLRCMHALQSTAESKKKFHWLWLLPMTGLVVLAGNLLGWVAALFPGKSRFPVNYWLILRKKKR